MIMRTVLSFCVLLLIHGMYAQAPSEEWFRTFDGTGTAFDEIRYVRLDAQQNVIVTGRSRSGMDSYLDVVTRMYDPAGDVLWTHTWNNEDLGFDDFPLGMEIAPNGNIVIIGNSKHSGDSQSNNADIFIIALSPAGDLLWSDHFSGTGHTSGGGWPIDISNAAGIAMTASGDIYVTGLTTGNSSTEIQQMVLAKYSSSGTQLWMETFDNSTVWGYSDYGTGVDVDAAGNAYVCGVTTLENSGRDPAVWKIDGNGQFQWIATYSGPINNTSEQFDGILVDDNGNSYAFGTNSMSRYVVRKHDPAGVEQWTYVLDTIVPGTSASFSGSDKQLAFDNDGNIIFTAGMDSRIGVAKFTPSGDLLWVSYHGGDTQFNNEAYHVAVDGMNNIYVAGAISNNGTSYDLGAFKIDPNGDQLWGVWHNAPANGNDKGHSMAIGNDGAIYVGGLGTGYTVSNGDYLLVKYMQGPVGVGETDGIYGRLYPNPAHGSVTLDIGASIARTIELADAQGRMIRSFGTNDHTGRIQLSLEGIAAGGYFLRVHTEHGPVVSRLMVQ